MKKNFFSPAILIGVLSVLSLILCLFLAISNWHLLLPVLVLMLLICIAIIVFQQKTQKLVAMALHTASFTRHNTTPGLAGLNLPLVITCDKNIIWYNDLFKDEFLNGTDASLLPVRDVIRTFDISRITQGGFELSQNGKEYTVYGCCADEKNNLFVSVFAENTALKVSAKEYNMSRPCVMMITIDTYNEILRDLKESERTRIIGDIEVALEKFFARTSGFVMRTGNSTYMAVIEKRHMDTIAEKRFDLLDTVRKIGSESVIVTLSIGVGMGAQTMHDCRKMAAQALDMALGRGGDQAAVKTPDGYSFFGGVSHSVEKRSKVKSRIIANALSSLIKESSSVLIMGHKMSDLDAIGSALGVLHICKNFNKPSAIVVRQNKTLASPLIKQFNQAGFDYDFIEPEEAMGGIDDKTLLVIVDTHVKFLLESSEIYDKCKTVVVIDHHRKVVGHIEDADIFFHESYASSACELVSEILQHYGGEKPTALVAQALLAGITLDTRNFALHTGVRTFEAAAYLRRMGAQTQEVKKLFASSFDEFAYKADLITQAEIFLGCAIVFSSNLPPELAVVIPQTANELLSIEGVQASFVAVEVDGVINVSARSMGEVNVQLIMEQLGGGGHLTMAGAQFKNTEVQEVKDKLLNAISTFREEEQRKLTAKND